jgi:hypothetical protein
LMINECLKFWRDARQSLAFSRTFLFVQGTDLPCCVFAMRIEFVAFGAES